MKAILFSGRTVIGTHMDPPIEEMERLGTQYILVEEIPEIILTCPPTHRVELVDGECVLVEIPPEPTPDPTADQLRIAQLEEQNLTNMLAIFDLFAENEQLKIEDITNKMAIFDLFAEIEAMKGGE